MRKARILVVDDSVVVRKLVTEVLAAEPEFEVVGTAANGRIALAKLALLNPDIVTLDMEMPELDGLGTLRALRQLPAAAGHHVQHAHLPRSDCHAGRVGLGRQRLRYQAGERGQRDGGDRECASRVGA